MVNPVGVWIVFRTVALMRDARGGGSMRQRRPGVWEVRIAVGPDPVSGHSRYRSLTVHGDRETAQAARERWAAQAELVRSSGRSRPGITLAALLREWLCADHGWRPSTVVGYRSVARFLTQDPVGKRRAVDLTPKVLAAACADWRSQEWPDPTVWARIRVLRSALGWAYAERIVDLHPLDGMRSPPHAAVRMHAPVDQVRAILACARQQAIDAAIREGRSPSDNAARHRAEQTLLPTRLAADSGARRGELAALQLGDLDGDILTIARATSNEVVGPTKSGRIRRLTLGPTTAALWRHTVTQWRQRAGEGQRFGPWLFSRRADHTTRLSTSCLAHWFAELCADAGHPDVTLHRLRHTVATTLVSQGDILQAQYRLGHRDAATTLRIYSHVLPLTDHDVAATLDALYRP
jgi:integrase